MSSTHNGTTVVFDNFASRSPSMRPSWMMEISVGLNSLLSIHRLLMYFCVSPRCHRSLMQWWFFAVSDRGNIEHSGASQLAGEFLLLLSHWASPKVFLCRRHLRCEFKWKHCNNIFAYSDQAGNTFNRVVSADFDVITSDQQSGTLAPAPAPAEAS